MPRGGDASVRGLVFTLLLSQLTLLAMFVTFRQRGRHFILPVVTPTPRSRSLKPLTSRQAEIPRIHFMAMTYEGMLNLDVWNDWYIRSRIKMSELGIEPLTQAEIAGLSNCTAPESRFLTWQLSYVHGRDGRLLRRKTPCWMADEIIELSEFSEWGNLVGMYTNLKVAVGRFPDASHYVLLTETSIPVTLLPSMLTDLAADARTRFRVWVADILDCAPKHLALVIFAREDAEYLAANPYSWVYHGDMSLRDLWVLPKTNKSHGELKCAGPDEFWPAYALLERDGFIEKHKGEQGETCLSQQIFPTNINWLISEMHDFRFYHWTTWFDVPPNRQRDVLGVITPAEWKHPVVFKSIQFRLLQYLSEQEGVWLARKFAEGANALNCRRDDNVHNWHSIFFNASTDVSNECSLREAMASIYDTADF